MGGAPVPSLARSNRSLRGLLTRGCVLAVNVLKASSLATQRAEVVQLGAPNLGGTQQLHLVDHARALRENTLDALTEADLAHRKAGLRTSRTRDHNPFKSLSTFLVAFLNLDVYADGVARNKLRKVGALGFSQQFFNDEVRHNLFPCSKSSRPLSGLVISCLRR